MHTSGHFYFCLYSTIYLHLCQYIILISLDKKSTPYPVDMWITKWIFVNLPYFTWFFNVYKKESRSEKFACFYDKLLRFLVGLFRSFRCWIRKCFYSDEIVILRRLYRDY